MTNTTSTVTAAVDMIIRHAFRGSYGIRLVATSAGVTFENSKGEILLAKSESEMDEQRSGLFLSQVRRQLRGAGLSTL